MRIRSSRGMRGALLIGFTLLGATAARAAMNERLPRDYLRTDQEEVAFRAAALADQLIPLPAEVTVQRHVIGPDGIQRDGTATNPEGKLIYSSTHGSRLALLDWDGTELRTTAVDGADMTSFIVRVSGGVEEGEGEFACTMRLYDTLPGCGAQLIPGTEYTFDGLSDSIDIVHELMVDVSSDPVPIPRLAWTYVSCDAASAAWLIGPLPEIGYSTHNLDYPLGYCCLWFYGYPRPLPSSRYVQVFAREDSPTEFLTYLTLNGCAYPYVPEGGPDVRVADDLMLVHEGCELSSFELGVVGDAGPYEMNIDLRVHPTLGPMPGTERVFVGEGDGSLEIARFTFGPGIELPQNVWITWKPNLEHTGAARAAHKRIGSTAQTFMMENFCGYEGWHTYSHYVGKFHAGVYCQGDPPTGACCLEPAPRLYDGQCIDDLPRISCGGRWIEGAACVDEPFDPPCGTHACCKPDNSCADLTEEECADEGGFWEEDEFCGVNGQDCGWFACRAANDDCYTGHLPAGCWWRSCCNEICDIDPCCCTESWSAMCVRLAEEECNYRPRHDECWEIEYRTVREAREIAAQGTTTVTNKHATYSADDPFVCCHVQGVDHYSLNTMWFRFTATDNSARISTCGTAEGDGADSIIQVYSIADSDVGRCHNDAPCSVAAQDCADGSTCVFDGEMACQTLEIIGCNDDSPHCGNGSGLSDVCVTGLMPGDIYYIMLASPTSEDAGIYQLDVESPCPIMPPANNYCETGFLVFDETRPFDLAYATIDCPGEPCVNAMKNDLWYEYIASCTGNLIAESHGLTPEDDDPATTLVVYDDFTCPPDQDSVLGRAEGSSLTVPVFSCQNYLVRLGGVFGSEPAGQVTFTCIEGDCQPNGVPDALDIAGATSEDHDGNGIPDECDPHFMAYMTDGLKSWLTPGDPGVRYVEDLHLPTTTCELRSYQAMVVGWAGAFEIEFDLRLPDASEPIPGTERAFVGTGHAGLERPRFTFGHGLYIPPDVRLTWKTDQAGTGVAIAKETVIGQTEGDTYYLSLTCYGNPPYHVIWIEPPGGVVDARQPHAIADSAELQGIETMVIAARSDADEVGQWSLCETDPHGVPNEIAGVEAGTGGLFAFEDGLHTIRLDRPISPGATTAITYENDQGTSTGIFKSHPANVDGDTLADAFDIGSLIDCCLNETCAPTWENYSCDIDRSGKVGAADLLRLIDLLNGASTFEPWIGSNLPPDECEP